MTTNKRYDYINQSRGHKTKGNTYKDRYVNDVCCPECGHTKAYKDTWKTKLAYSCMKRDCRKKWYVDLTPEQIAELREAREKELNHTPTTEEQEVAD